MNNRNRDDSSEEENEPEQEEQEEEEEDEEIEESESLKAQFVASSPPSSMPHQIHHFSEKQNKSSTNQRLLADLNVSVSEESSPASRPSGHHHNHHHHRHGDSLMPSEAAQSEGLPFYNIPNQR
jgi:hypothetical protein